MEGQSRMLISMLPNTDPIQESQQNGGMKSTGRTLGRHWARVKNAMGNGLLKAQAKPSIKGPEWNPNVPQLGANGLPIYSNTDDLFKHLIKTDSRWIQRPDIPLKYQIRPTPQQPPSPQNTRPRPLTPNADSQSTFHYPYPNYTPKLQEQLRMQQAARDQQMLRNRLSRNGRLQPFLPTYPKVGPNGEHLNFGKIYP